MIQVIFTFFTSISLAAIAAFFSIIGLAQIFPGSFWPIIIMGTVIEISKLVTVSWLYNNWKETHFLLKSYFLSAIIIIMLITSMGIFGYLSKSHIESNIIVGSNSIQLKILEQQENIVKDRLSYLLLKAGNDPEKISRSTDRAIQEAQNELKKLTEQKLPLLKEENLLLAEIGPIKYIAELIYERSDPSFIDKAVRVVILLIIFVFDPLAVLLLVAANQSYRKVKPELIKKQKKIDKILQKDVKYNDNDMEIIPKSKITKMMGGKF